MTDSAGAAISELIDLRQPAAPPQCGFCGALGRQTAAIDAVRVSLEDRSCTVDVCAEHLDELREVFEGVLAASASRQRRRPSPDAFPRLLAHEQREQVRQWALAEGLPVSRSGSISAAVLESYRTAHGDGDDIPTPRTAG